MTAKSHEMGHAIEFDSSKNQWVYSDNGELISVSRPCIRCGVEACGMGYDPCIGFLNGVESACCGHGVSDGIMIIEKKIEMPLT